MGRSTRRNRRSSKKGRTRRGLRGGADEVDQSVVLERCKGVCARVVSEFNGSGCRVHVATSDFVASSKYLEWLGAGMSRLAYNSPLVALAMWTTLTRNTQPLIGGTTLSNFFDKLNTIALCKPGPDVGAYTVDGWNEDVEGAATKFVNGYYTEVFSKYLKKKPDILPGKEKLPDTFWDEDALRESIAKGVETKDTNFEMVYVHTSEDLSCYLVADKKANAIFIVFRGSRSLSNWKKNFTVHTKAGCTDPCNVSHKLQCKDGEKEEMKMYPGFLGLDLEAIHTIVWMGAHLAKTVIGATAIKPARVFMFGHSLGGALATISSLLYSMMRAPGLEPARAKDGLKLLCPRVTCISYASPRPFNKAADECFNLRKDIGLISFARLFTAGDPVPTMAPWMDGAGTTDDKRKVKGSKALVAARVLTLGAAGVVSHAFEDGINYTSLISARMQAVASELRKVAGGGCENKHLIFVELLGPIKPKSGNIPIEAAIRLLGEVGSQISGTTSSGKACSEWVDEDIRSESSLSKDILDELKGVATTKGRLDVSGCLAHAQEKAVVLKAQMEESVHTARDKPKAAAKIVEAQQTDMQICLPSAAAAGGGLSLSTLHAHLSKLKKNVGAKASAAAASAKKGIEKAKGKLTKSPSTAPSEAATPETPATAVAQKHALAPAQSDEARKRECIVSCQCGSRASQGGSKRSSSSTRRERAGVIDLIDHLHVRRASLERALRTTGKGSESTFLRTRKRGIDNELQRAHGLIATLDRSRQRRASKKTRRRPRGGGH